MTADEVIDAEASQTLAWVEAGISWEVISAYFDAIRQYGGDS